jgi:hypothetical protein
MWMIPVKNLCNKHLLGEHGEIHKHRHNFAKGHSMEGRISPVVQIEPSSMGTRHDELAQEMISRGMNHQSPYEMPDLSKYPDRIKNAKVDLEISYSDLCERCEACSKRIKA